MLAHQPTAIHLLFITLRKREALFSPTGQQTIHHEAREQRRVDDRPGGITEPFRWRLEREIPAAWLPGCSTPSLALAV